MCIFIEHIVFQANYTLIFLVFTYQKNPSVSSLETPQTRLSEELQKQFHARIIQSIDEALSQT